jgi:hypothetical protein
MDLEFNDAALVLALTSYVLTLVGLVLLVMAGNPSTDETEEG